jgi:hypothetical protein
MKELLDNKPHTWYDNTGNGYNGVLSNKYPVRGSTAFQFNGSNNVQIPNVNFSTGAYTIITVSRYNGSPRGRMVTSIYNNWLLGHWGGSTENYYAEGWVSNVSSGAGDDNWRVLVATGNTATDAWQIYVNGTLTFANSNGAAGPNGLGVCSYDFARSELSTGECSYIAGYNRVLTDSEIKDATQALRTKFGI